MINSKNIGQIIKNLRKQKHFSQEELAEKIDISTNHLSKIERGLSRLNVEAFLRMAEILSFNLEAFGINSNHNQDPVTNEILYKLLGSSEKKKILYLKALNFIDEILK